MYDVTYGSKGLKDLEGYGIKDNGYNHMPTPFKRCTREEFMRGTMMSPWTVEHIDHGQVVDPEGDTKWYWDATYYIMHNAAYAMLWFHGYRYNDPQFPGSPAPKDFDEFISTQRTLVHGGDSGYWVRYYRLGCKHPRMTEKTVGNCLHRYDCPDCGFTQELDSSG